MVSKPEKIIKLSFVLTIFLFVIASFLWKSFWGFNHLYFLDQSLSLLILVVAAILILLLYVPLPDKKLNLFFDKIHDLIWENNRVLHFVLIGIFPLIFLFGRVSTYFLGDGYTWVAVFEHPESFIHKPTEFLSSYLVRWMQILMGGASQETSILTFKILSIASGAVVVNNLILISSRVTRDKAIRLLSLFTLLFSGSILLYFGYIEFYPVLWMAATTYIFFALRFIDSKKGLPLVIASFVFALTMHLQAIYFIGGFGALFLFYYYSNRSAKELPDSIKWTCALLVSVTLIMFIWRYVTHIEFALLFLPVLNGWPRSPNYAIFSLDHLFDIFNQFLLIIPGLLILLAAVLAGKKKINYLNNWKFLFLALSSIGSLLFLFVIDPFIGLARDWDLMSLTLLAPALSLLLMLAMKNIKISGRILLTYGLICLLITGSFLAVNIKVDSSEKRYEALLTTDQDNRSRNGWLILANYYFGQSDEVKAKEVITRMNRRCPDYLFLSQAYGLMQQGNYSKAFQIAKQLIEKDPYSVSYLELLGSVHTGYGNYIEAKESYDKALTMKPYSISTKIGLANMYSAQQKYSESIKLYKEVIRFAPKRTDVIENLASSYINNKQFNEATKLADKLFVKDNNSPVGHVIMLSMCSESGQKKLAKDHYLAFTEHGKERPDYQAVINYFKEEFEK